MSYEMSQFLTGHGSFAFYLKKMGKTDSDQCKHCEDTETAGHTLFLCPYRWAEERAVQKS